LEQALPTFGIIYKATNVLNGKVYIGQTIRTLLKRQAEHIRITKRNPEQYFHKAIHKYNAENFEWEVVDYASSIEELNEKEKEWIWLNYSNNSQFGYNLTEGGEGSSGRVVSKETKLLIGSKSKNRFVSEEAREKHRISSKGRRHSEETKKVMSAKGKLRSQSEEARLKNSLAHKGKKVSEESCMRQSEMRRGKKKMTDGITIKMVHRNDIVDYLNKGWNFYSKLTNKQ